MRVKVVELGDWVKIFKRYHVLIGQECPRSKKKKKKKAFKPSHIHHALTHVNAIVSKGPQKCPFSKSKMSIS